MLPLIGFEKVQWRTPRITLPAGMEIDFGGFGKEYAVDRVLAIIGARFSGAALVNFGGDLAANRAPVTGPWQVGVYATGLCATHCAPADPPVNNDAVPCLHRPAAADVICNPRGR